MGSLLQIALGKHFNECCENPNKYHFIRKRFLLPCEEVYLSGCGEAAQDHASYEQQENSECQRELKRAPAFSEPLQWPPPCPRVHETSDLTWPGASPLTQILNLSSQKWE